MKARLLALTAALLITALLPLLAVGVGKSTPAAPTTAHETATPTQAEQKDILPGLVAAACEKDFCPEAVRAVTIIINTCLSFDRDCFDLTDESIYNSNIELNDELADIVDSNSESHISIDGKIRYIPFSKASCGYTQADEKYPYLCSVASPWDCFNAYFDEDEDCIGVSLSGINYLCQNGCTAEEAIKWYLPGAEIK